MAFKPAERLMVDLEIEGELRHVGELGWSMDERRAYFQYAAEFLDNWRPLSPFHLRALPHAQPADYEPFDGLHGLFNDSLPDGWGRLLLDRRLQTRGIDHFALTPLDRLSAVGEGGMGALRYRPVSTLFEPVEGNVDLEEVATEVERVQAEVAAADIDLLQAAQGSSAGARPKIMVGISADGDAAVLDFGQELAAGFERWMVKFPSKEDPEDIGAQERAYALMAEAAGIDMPSTRLLETNSGRRLFATKRFDRTPRGRLHMQTVSGLVHADHRYPSLDYGQLLKATRVLTRSETEVMKVFTRAAFNVFAHNRDDHAKNHAFLMDRTGCWAASPAYDLTYSTGPGGEHSMLVAGEGRSPTREHLLKLADEQKLEPENVAAALERVRDAIADWSRFADEAGLPRSSAETLKEAMEGRGGFRDPGSSR